MANPNIANVEYGESGVLIVDNGATITLCNTLFIMSHVQHCSVNINLAGKGMLIKAIHGGYKAYYIKDVSGTDGHVTGANQSTLCT